MGVKDSNLALENLAQVKLAVLSLCGPHSHLRIATIHHLTSLARIQQHLFVNLLHGWSARNVHSKNITLSNSIVKIHRIVSLNPSTLRHDLGKLSSEFIEFCPSRECRKVQCCSLLVHQHVVAAHKSWTYGWQSLVLC